MERRVWKSSVARLRALSCDLPVSRPMHRPYRTFLYLLASVLLTGCLPTSCNRVESRVITAADSTSRALAASLPVDTMRVVFKRTYREEEMRNPRTILFDDRGQLLVTDTRTSAIHRLGETGDILSTMRFEGTIPYLAGLQSDTTWVFSPSDGAMHRLIALRPDHVTMLDLETGNERALRWAIRTDSGYVSKVLDDDAGNRIVWYDEHGTVRSRISLPGPSWRYAGMLRNGRAGTISLSGFLPFLYEVTPAGLDSTRLVGFDSPMLARTLQFERGTVEQPPLLSGSAALAGDWLFVLNMRPGWLHVDVFDAAGRLAYILTQPDPSFSKEYYPTDIAVKEGQSGEFHLAVTVTEPAPGVERYVWTMPQRVEE